MSKLEKLDKNEVKLTIEIESGRFEEALQKAYIQTGKRYSIPGFRKGKLAPRKVIENFYGGGVFFEEAFEQTYGELYDAAIDEHNLHPVSMPDVEIEQIGEGQPVIFSAKVTLKPEVVLGAYKGIEVEKVEYTVTDSDVDAEIEKVRERNARFVDVTRPAEAGDRVNIDYAGAIGGVAFPGGTAQSQTLEIGSGRFIPGFEEQLVGLSAEEEKDIVITFPEDYHDETLSGKEAVFHIHLHEVKEKELSDVDDEFAKDVSEFDTLQEYKDSLRKRFEESASGRARNEMLDAAVDTVVKNAEVDIPDVMVERQIGYMLRDLETRLRYQGMTLEDYCKYTQTELSALREEMREEAHRRVKMQLVLEAIQAKEAVEIDDEALDKELSDMAERAKKPLDEYKKDLGESEIGYIRSELEMRKTVDMLLDSAVLTAPKDKTGNGKKNGKKADDKDKKNTKKADNS